MEKSGIAWDIVEELGISWNMNGYHGM